MSLLKPDSDEKSRRDMKQISLFAAIPGLLLAGPLIGYVIGWWLDGKFGTQPYLAALGVFMGIAASGLEIVQVIRKASSAESDGDNEKKSEP